jgi:hypothetical protein
MHQKKDKKGDANDDGDSPNDPATKRIHSESNLTALKG